MLNVLKMVAVIAVVSGLMTGCSSNKPAEDIESPMDAMTDSMDTSGTEDTSVVVEQDPMEYVSNVFYFEFDSAMLTSEARSALLLHAEDLKATGRSVRLEGHADERGSREYNMALGERRANAVRDFLVLQGVSRAQLETISYGEESPAQMGNSEFSWSKNRRTELK